MAMYQDDGRGSYPRDFLRLIIWILILSMAIVFFVMLFPHCSCAADPWTKSDTVREAAFQTLHAVDYLQTRTIARHPEKYYERNPVLGKHPSEENVIVYFAAGAVAHGVISYYLPDPYRQIFQYVTIGLSSACVLNNFNIGLRVSW
uniref:Uncharacterized protein n=1 Tax=viral metagenome TaxID=1070528 RepID=A0A6H1ZMG4_9ZZZZ